MQAMHRDTLLTILVALTAIVVAVLTHAQTL